MTTVSLLQATDVVALKCIYFQLVKSMKEIDWYGLNCNSDDYENSIDIAFSYLQLIESGCARLYPLECEIKTFITKRASFCVFDDDRCPSKYTITNLGIVG